MLNLTVEIIYLMTKMLKLLTKDHSQQKVEKPIQIAYLNNIGKNETAQKKDHIHNLLM